MEMLSEILTLVADTLAGEGSAWADGLIKLAGLIIAVAGSAAIFWVSWRSSSPEERREAMSHLADDGTGENIPTET